MFKKLTALLTGSTTKPALQKLPDWGSYSPSEEKDTKGEGEKLAPVPEIPYKTQASAGLVDGLRDCLNRKNQIGVMQANLNEQSRLIEIELKDTLLVQTGYAAALLEIDAEAYQAYSQEDPTILPIELDGLELDLDEPVVNPHNQGFFAAYEGFIPHDAEFSEADLKTYGETTKKIEKHLREQQKLGLDFDTYFEGFAIGSFWRQYWSSLDPADRADVAIKRTRRVK